MHVARVGTDHALNFEADAEVIRRIVITPASITPVTVDESSHEGGFFLSDFLSARGREGVGYSTAPACSHSAR